MSIVTNIIQYLCRTKYTTRKNQGNDVSKMDRIHRFTIKIDNHIHDQIECFRYLGSIISPDG